MITVRSFTIAEFLFGKTEDITKYVMFVTDAPAILAEAKAAAQVTVSLIPTGSTASLIPTLN